MGGMAIYIWVTQLECRRYRSGPVSAERLFVTLYKCVSFMVIAHIHGLIYHRLINSSLSCWVPWDRSQFTRIHFDSLRCWIAAQTFSRLKQIPPLCHRQFSYFREKLQQNPYLCHHQFSTRALLMVQDPLPARYPSQSRDTHGSEK